MLRNLMMTVAVLVLSSGIFYTTLFNLNPLGAQPYLAWLTFYVSLVCGIWSFFTLFFFFAAEMFTGYKLGDRQFLVAVRRGALVALLAFGLIVLQYFRFLGPIEGLLWLMFVCLIEWIFLTSR